MCEGKVFQQCKTWNIHFDIFAWKNFQTSKLFFAINKHRPRTYWPTQLGRLYTHRAFAYPEIFCRNKKILCSLIKGRISSEKYWYYFHCPKKVLCPILSFVFWIFSPLDTAVQFESADSKQKAISKSLFQDIFGAMRKMRHTFWK